MRICAALVCIAIGCGPSSKRPSKFIYLVFAEDVPMQVVVDVMVAVAGTPGGTELFPHFKFED